MLAFGYGRAARIHTHNASLEQRSLEEVEYSCQYTVALALEHMNDEAKADAFEDMAVGDKDDEEAPNGEHLDRVARVWHFLQTAAQPSPAQPLLPPPDGVAAMPLTSASSWFDSRIIAKAGHIASHIIDLRRLCQAVESGGARHSHRIPIAIPQQPRSNHTVITCQSHPCQGECYRIATGFICGDHAIAI